MAYRALTQEEIEILQYKGCHATDWSLVRVEPSKAGLQLKRVRLIGEVNLGAECRVSDTTVVSSTIGQRTVVQNVERLQNYVVGNDCHIYNCGSIVASEYASMGCGTTVDVLDETGGRQTVICPELSAQMAYMMAFYRHNPALTRGLVSLVEAWGKEHSERQGRIGDGVTISYVTAIDDVNIGDRSMIRSAVKLQNGTLGAETQVLENVSAADFILSSQATLGTTCVAKHVFLGQAARLGNGFVAHNSLIFANSVLECGETDALFAGPHTVSFHRSTLLIAAALSFFNAGSGTNQSNHYYCTGPVHHGIMERGCKTGSNSYVKWPARLGQFSVVIGSHINHPDTSRLPFSYLFGNDGVTTVVPAANLKTCGIMRDVLKWRGRDGRSDAYPRLDCICYDEFTPYNAEKMFQGIAQLQRIRDDEDYARRVNFTVSPWRITEGIRLYRLGLRYFFGKVLAERINAIGQDGKLSLEALMQSETEGADVSIWVDMAGMIAPRSVVDELCDRIAKGEVPSLSALGDELRGIHQRYEAYRWLYVRERLGTVFGLMRRQLTLEDLALILRQWTEAARELCQLRSTDALKDFAPDMCVGFGIDHPELAQADFENARGRVSDNPHIEAIRSYYAADEQRARQALQVIAAQ
ncbi:MAG: DUF4954 family protein [Prevotellaceae bacterium]|nr:DUF4954 family protein [Prevotellaceae bacterium]